jgi:hypothetical protein
MSRRWRQRIIILSLVIFGCAHDGAAQDDFAKAVLALPSTAIGDSARLFDTPLFDGRVDATITDQNGSNTDFAANDLISFRALSTRPGSAAGEGFTVPFVGTRDQFETWARTHAKELLEVFFPSGLAAALSGRDTTAIYSQQLFLTTILDTTAGDERRRRPSAGLFDTEWIHENDDQSVVDQSAWAMQGLYAFSPAISIQARYGSRSRALTTKTTSAVVDYHPFIERGSDVIVRAGGLARAGFLYSSTAASAGALDQDPMRLGVIDYSGGGWSSVLRQFGRVLLGGGGLFQITKHQALEGDKDNFRKAFARAINDRGLEYDLTAGGTARFDLNNRTSVLGSYAGTFALESDVDRPASHAIVGAVMHALGPGATISGGYKTTLLRDARAHSIFFQGSFGW